MEFVNEILRMTMYTSLMADTILHCKYMYIVYRHYKGESYCYI